HVQAAPAAQGVAELLALGAAGGGVDVVRGLLEQRRDLAVREGRVQREEDRGGRRDLRRRERRPLRITVLVGTAVGEALRRARRPEGRQRERQGREDSLSRGGEVVVDRVAVREVRHVPGVG